MISNEGKQVLFIATSLDGYIATKEDSLDWLFEVEGEGDNGYGEFIKNIDCIVMGRRTYDWIIRETKSDFPYRAQKCFVFSNRNDQLEYVEIVNENVKSFVSRIKSEYKNIWIVGGGELIREYMELNEIDEYRITIAPVILGNGVKLFNEINNKIKLSLVQINRRNQFVELVYQRK
jgi:dihydrofolate reductase